MTQYIHRGGEKGGGSFEGYLSRCSSLRKKNHKHKAPCVYTVMCVHIYTYVYKYNHANK